MNAYDRLIELHAKGSPARAITARSALDTFLAHKRELRELCGYGTDVRGGWNTVVIGLAILGQHACSWASSRVRPRRVDPYAASWRRAEQIRADPERLARLVAESPGEVELLTGAEFLERCGLSDRARRESQ